AGLPIPVETPGKIPGLLFSDVLILVSIGILIAIGLIVWAVFIRQPNENKPSFPPPTAKIQDKRKRRRKKIRREQRSRNPSLADTGGLPSADSSVGGLPPQS